jgi:hypothetical protein
MGMPKRCNWQAAPDEGVSPELDSALTIWYCGQAISVPLVKRKPKLGHDQEPCPSFQSAEQLPHESRSAQNPDKGSPHSHSVSDLTQSTCGLPEIESFSSVESSEGRGRIMSCVCSVSSSVECERSKNSESESRSVLNSPAMHQRPSVINAGNWVDGEFERVLSETDNLLRLSPIGNKCARDIQIKDFDSGAAAEDASALEKSKLLAQWTGMGEATFKPGTKMEEAINVKDLEVDPWGTNTASSRRRRPVSAQACLSPLQRQRTSKQLEAANAAAESISDSAFSRRWLYPAHHGFEGSSKQSRTDVKTSPGTIKQRLDAGLQRCMQLRVTELLEHGGLLYLGNKDDKAMMALKALDKKSNGFELHRSDSDSALRSRQKLGWPSCPQGQISRGLKSLQRSSSTSGIRRRSV